MSYPQNSTPGGTHHGAGPPPPPRHNSNSTETSSHMQSPVDWAHFVNFSTTPSATEGSNPNLQRHSSHGDGSQNHSDQYRFAQSLAARPPPDMAFQHPYPHQQPQQMSQHSPHPHQPQHHQQHPQQQHQPHIPSPQSGQFNNNVHLPPNTVSANVNRAQNPNRSPAVYLTSQTINKGKAPAIPHANQGAAPLIAAGGGNDSNGDFNGGSHDNGLSLDPSAFTRELRFQMPSFLSNQASGAPTFPPGGEAWTGFAASNMFGNQDSGTPSGMFGFSQPFDGHMNSGPESNGESRNVLEGLSDFLGDSGTGLTPNFGTAMYPNGGSPNNQPTQGAQPPQQNQMMNDPMQSSGGSNFSQPPSNQQNTMPTASILPQQNHGFSGTNNFNIASSSTQPYAPPSNTAHLLTQRATIAPPFAAGPSVQDGPGLYSTTGFDMVGVLSRVANRKDPKTILGPVDLSCSFVVVDVRKFDCPIVYASPTFTALTGYDLPSILNRNCRFLQSPDGDVVKGTKRRYTDNVAVAHLKRMLGAGKECQASLINYRKGGVPFINLVTIVPIPWDGTDIVYHVGFQVDLVEQPNAILRNMRDGTYQVNYTVANPPQPPLRLPNRDVGASGLSQEILDIMGSRVNAPGFSQGDDGGKMEWLKFVLENSDDFIHVLSLKGSFQYVSPSVRRVLEYEPEDLLNKNVSDFCHPSDIVPLMRELKDSTHAPMDGQPARVVNLIFRIRRKNSGYVWMESIGRLHVEPGKGRKAVILSGRERTVPILPWQCVERNGGLAEVEFWSKVSFQGLVLYATSSVQDVLGQPADDVVGHSFYSLLPGGDNGPPSNAQIAADPTSPAAQMAVAFRTVTSGNLPLEKNGAVTIKHPFLTKNGRLVEVVSVIYAPQSSSAILGKTESDEDDSPTSEDTRPTSVSSTSISGTKPSYLVVQTKVLNTAPQDVSMGNVGASTTEDVKPTLTRPIVHALSANVFEELETTRGTSWQYELHQLRLLNRRLKEDVNEYRKSAAGNGRSKGAGKKKAEIVLPDQYNAAPRHQLAPGFGLMPPGVQSPYF